MPSGEYAHRSYYEQANGPIPAGMAVHHLCHNRACVNPAHLTPMLQPEHARLHFAGVDHGGIKAYCSDCGKRVHRDATRCCRCDRIRRARGANGKFVPA